MSDHKIAIEPLDTASVSSASRSWLKYLRRKEKIVCPNCGQSLLPRVHFLSDFYIGGFASAKCDAILTRDRGIYRKYFPTWPAMRVAYRDRCTVEIVYGVY